MVEVCVRACVKEKISNDRITRNAYEVNKSLPQKITDYITVREIIVEDTAFVYVIDVNDNVVDMSKITKLNLERYGINHTFTKMNSLFKELISTNRGLMYRINGIYSKKNVQIWFDVNELRNIISYGYE